MGLNGLILLLELKNMATGGSQRQGANSLPKPFHDSKHTGSYTEHSTVEISSNKPDSLQDIWICFTTSACGWSMKWVLCMKCIKSHSSIVVGFKIWSALRIKTGSTFSRRILAVQEGASLSSFWWVNCACLQAISTSQEINNGAVACVIYEGDIHASSGLWAWKMLCKLQILLLCMNSILNLTSLLDFH